MKENKVIQGYAGQIPEEVKGAVTGLDNDIRLAIIVALMENSQMSFTSLRGLLNIKQSSLVHHLSLMQNGGLVRNFMDFQSQGNYSSYYEVTDMAKSILESLYDIIVKIPHRDVRSEVVESQEVMASE